MVSRQDEKTRNLIEKELDDTPSLRDSTKEILGISIPIYLNFFCYFFQQSISYLFLKFNDPTQSTTLISSIAMTNLYINSTTLAIGLGLLSGIDILCSNAYGSKNYYLMGVYLHRGRFVVMTIVFILGFFNFFYGATLISVFVVEKQIIDNISIYIKLTSFTVFLTVIESANQRYLNILRKSHIITTVVISTMPFHILWCYIYIVVFDLGIIGAGLAPLTTHLINNICTYSYVHVSNPCPESYFFPNQDCFRGWWEFVKFASPQLFLAWMSFLGFEIQGMIAYKCSLIDFNTHIIGVALFNLLKPATIAYAISMNITIGRMIVQKSIDSTKITLKRILILGNLFMTFFAVLYFIFKNQLFLYFVDENTDIEVINKGKVLVYFILILAYLDINTNMLTSLFRALHKQKISTFIGFIGFNVVQNIFSLIFAFYFGYGVYGCWLGLISGCLFCCLSYMILYYSYNIKEIKRLIIQKLHSDFKKLEVRVK